MTRNRYYQGPATDHFDGQLFFNPGQPSTDKSLRDLVRWRREGTRAAWPPPAPPGATAKPADREGGVAITMVGHASLLVQAANLNILVDPVWSERASPVRFAGPKRWDAPGIRFDDLPRIDAVLVTHSHYDHLDVPTLQRLHAGHAPMIVGPLGTDTVIARAVPGARVQSADWGGTVELGPGVRATLHPAYHWSARSPWDRRMALWCGFVLETPAGAVYLAGDTAYGDGGPFREVRARFGPPAVAVLPIGAYEPRWFMSGQHMNPDDAVRALLDCGAQTALGVHWGTFQLTDEARLAPLEALDAACGRHGVDRARFRALHTGQVWRPGVPTREL